MPSKSRKRRHWLWPLIFAIVLFLGDISIEVLGDEFKELLKPYRKWVWLTCGLALLAALVVAWREWRSGGADDYDDDAPPPSPNQSDNISIGGNVTGSTVNTGQGHVISHNTAGDVVARDKITIINQARDSSSRLLHQLPTPSADFIGRAKELDEIRQHCQSGLTIPGVQGIGGVGKTALALKLADELKPAYPDAQFYLDLQGVSEAPLTSAQAMAHVIRAYQPETKLPDDESALSALYRSVLDQQKALLLLDNAKDAAQVAPLVPPPGCLLLVTSRQHFGLPGFHAIPLDSLTPADACALLLKIEPRIGEAADELAELCGRLPLALELAAHALKTRTNLTPADYARRLREAESRLDVLDKIDFPRKIKAAISSSYDLLSIEQQKLWRALAVFPGTFNYPAAAAVWEIGSDDTQDSLSELMGYSLIEFSQQEQRYRLHALARVFAKSKLSESEQEIIAYHQAAHFCNLLAVAGELYLQGGEATTLGLGLYDQERDNIEVGQAWAVNHQHNEAAVQLCIDYIGSLGVVELLALRLPPRERIRWLEVQLAATRRLQKRDYEGYALNNLGIAYNALGETRRAIEFFEQSLVIDRQISDSGAECNTLGNLASAYFLLGEISKAIELYKQVLVVSRKMNDYRAECRALLGLGNAYDELGKTQESIECFEQALLIARSIGNRRDEGKALWNRSLGLNKLGKSVQAIAGVEAALSIYEEIGDPYAETMRRALTQWHS